jgi:hypothetical protein
MKYYSLTVMALLALMFTQATAQTKSEAKVPEGAKIFIAPMQGDLHPFIAAEVVKKKLPVVVVTDEKEADFILAGASIKGDDKWYHSVFGGKDKNEGSVQLLNVKDKTMVWAGEAGDRSLMWGGLRRGGQRKVADRIVNKMKKELFK